MIGEQRAGLDRLPFLDEHLGDRAIAQRPEFVLHLHRFDDHDGLACTDSVARLRRGRARLLPGIGATDAAADPTVAARRRSAAAAAPPRIEPDQQRQRLPIPNTDWPVAGSLAGDS